MSPAPQYFRLFANCLLVRGHARSTICDLQRGEIHLIPNDLEELLREFEDKPMQEILQSFAPDDQETVVEYYNFLFDKQLGMFHGSEELGLFPGLDLTFMVPTTIHNAIIDIGEKVFDYQKAAQELSALGCQGVQIRVFRPIELWRVRQLLDNFCTSRIRSIEVFLCYTAGLPHPLIAQLITDYPRLTSLVVHSAPFTSPQSPSSGDASAIYYTEEQLHSEAHCGFIGPSYFTVNLSHFTEALTANTCLNQKISIDQYGYIKNCPAMTTSFGHISQDSLLPAVANEAFTAMWATNKDQISVCKHCEFRYVCSDCRAFRSDPLDLLSKPEKCRYDPFTAEWGQSA